MKSVELTIGDSSFNVKEAYKSLRTNILFCGSDVKVIAITSCVPGEGKSNVSFNIARALADDGRKVIYVDGDLRKSVILNRYKVGKRIVGLSHYLSGQGELEDIIHSTNVEGLHMIFSGVEPPNPAELLGNSLFNDAIAFLRENYDYVIVDTPPMASVSDCAVISKVCDGVIMVIAAGSTNNRLAKTIKRQLERTGCRILGAVLNKIDTTKKEYYSNYYGTSYYSYKKYTSYYGSEKGDIEIIE